MNKKNWRWLFDSFFYEALHTVHTSSLRQINAILLFTLLLCCCFCCFFRFIFISFLFIWLSSFSSAWNRILFSRFFLVFLNWGLNESMANKAKNSVNRYCTYRIPIYKIYGWKPKTEKKNLEKFIIIFC